MRLRAVFNAYKKSEVLRAELELFRDERQKKIDALEDAIVALREEIAASDMLSEDAVAQKKDELSAMLDGHADVSARQESTTHALDGAADGPKGVFSDQVCVVDQDDFSTPHGQIGRRGLEGHGAG